ncbi:MAG: efflux RND transporter periplasmic adaptor subunit [Parcubacteria group bacterium]|jgi:multidrug resistance efflux pump
MDNNINQNMIENNNDAHSGKRSLLYLAVAGFLVAGIVVALYLVFSQNEIYVEKSLIEATPINLSSQNGGVLERTMVKAGDNIGENTPVALVGTEIVKSKEAGIVTVVNENIGKNFAPSEAVVTMVRPEDLRVVASIEEDKGLSDVKVGQKATFTVDAFGSKKFQGIVDEISPTSRQGDVVFNISTQRQLNEFDVKIRFDQKAYPELKNGMSAKSWIYKD